MSASAPEPVASGPAGDAERAARARIARDIAELAAIARGSATPGEHAAAHWAAARLRELGAADVRVTHFRYRRSFAQAHALHMAAAAGGALVAAAGRRRAARLLGRLVAGAALLSFELDYSGRRQFARQLPPAGEGASVNGRLGEGPRTLVVVAHLDAALTGAIWSPVLLRAGDAWARRSGRRASLALLPELAMLAALLGGRRALRSAAGALVGFAALVLECLRHEPVPGANDNASGVAAALELARRLTEQSLPATRVEVILPGCEEAGMGGMAAWLAEAKGKLDPARTLLIGLDTVGSGEPIVLAAEGGLWPVRYRPEDVQLVRRAATARGLDPPRPWRLGAWTDPALARLAGLPAVSLLSVRDGGFPNYHRPSDTPDRVDVGCVLRCVELAEAVAREWAEA